MLGLKSSTAAAHHAAAREAPCWPHASALAACKATPTHGMDCAPIACDSLKASRGPISRRQPSVATPGFCSPHKRTLVRAAGQARETLSLPRDRDLEVPIDGFDSIADALVELAAGKFVVVLDDESRENEGDLIISADKVTTESMAFMVEYTSGVVCIAMEGKDLDRLKLPLMVRSDENEDTMYTAFTITVDLRHGITTGISAQDRTNTLRKLADPTAEPGDFRRPGHIFPLRYRPGGVLVRPGHTEASVDLARLSGSFPAGVLSEIVKKSDGSMARTPDLMKFAKEHGLKCISIADLMRYRLRHEQLVTLASSSTLNSRHGPLKVHIFKSALDGAEHIAVEVGEAAGQDDVLVNVQTMGNLSDLLGCSTPTGHLAERVLERMAACGKGISIFMQQTASARPSLQEEVQRLAAGQTGVSDEASLDLCDFGLAKQILDCLNVKSLTVASDHADQLASLRCCGANVKGVNGAANGHTMNGVSSTRYAVRA